MELCSEARRDAGCRATLRIYEGILTVGLDATQVEISRNANGDLVIHPIPSDRGAALLAALNAFDADFVSQLEENQTQQPVMQDREAL